jgi:hypothetical protein
VVRLTFSALEKLPTALLCCDHPPYKFGGRRHALDHMPVFHGILQCVSQPLTIN